MLKTFLIYVKGHKASEASAAETLDSFKGKSGWDVELFSGLTPVTLPDWEKKRGAPFPHKPKSRAAAFFEHDPIAYQAKKACALNEYILLKECLRINSPVAIIEHDVKCLRDWPSPNFEHVLVLNAKSGLWHRRVMHLYKLNWRLIINGPPKGVTKINVGGLNYRHDESMAEAMCSIGAGALAFTPEGAKRIVDSYDKFGWEQTDLLINTSIVNIEVLGPELFTWNSHTVELSYGKGF